MGGPQSFPQGLPNKVMSEGLIIGGGYDTSNGKEKPDVRGGCLSHPRTAMERKLAKWGWAGTYKGVRRGGPQRLQVSETIE